MGFYDVTTMDLELKVGCYNQRGKKKIYFYDKLEIVTGNANALIKLEGLMMKSLHDCVV